MENLDLIKKLSIVFLAIVGLVVVGFVIYYFLFVFQKSGTLVIKTDYPDAKYFVDGSSQKFTMGEENGPYYLSAEVSAGNHSLTAKDGNDNLVFEKSFFIKKDQKTEVEVKINNPETQDTLLEGE